MLKIDEILEYWIDPPHIDPGGYNKTKLWYDSNPDLDTTICSFYHFPNRNCILGHDSTPEKNNHIHQDGRTFGQCYAR